MLGLFKIKLCIVRVKLHTEKGVTVELNYVLAKSNQ